MSWSCSVLVCGATLTLRPLRAANSAAGARYARDLPVPVLGLHRQLPALGERARHRLRHLELGGPAVEALLHALQRAAGAQQRRHLLRRAPAAPECPARARAGPWRLPLAGARAGPAGSLRSSPASAPRASPGTPPTAAYSSASSGRSSEARPRPALASPASACASRSAAPRAWIQAWTADPRCRPRALRGCTAPARAPAPRGWPGSRSPRGAPCAASAPPTAASTPASGWAAPGAGSAAARTSRAPARGWGPAAPAGSPSRRARCAPPPSSR